ncbi:hypothetical protein [Haladaptatus sp. NG-SE-30]
MTYISRPVRGIRDHPEPDESVALLLRLADADTEQVRARVESLDGEVDAELEFETLRVVVPEKSVAELCELDGLDAIETAATLDVGAGDAGEDVELNDS